MFRKWLNHLREHYYGSLIFTIATACVSGGLIEVFYEHHTVQMILLAILIFSLAMLVFKALFYHFL